MGGRKTFKSGRSSNCGSEKPLVKEGEKKGSITGPAGGVMEGMTEVTLVDGQPISNTRQEPNGVNGDLGRDDLLPWKDDRAIDIELGKVR